MMPEPASPARSPCRWWCGSTDSVTTCAWTCGCTDPATSSARPPPDPADRPPAGSHQLRGHLPRERATRRGGPAVAVHAGHRWRRRPAAAVAGPGRRAPSGRRAVEPQPRPAAAGAGDHRAGPGGCRAARSDAVVGVGPRPDRRAVGRAGSGRHPRSGAGPRDLAAGEPPAAGARDPLPRVRRADVRPRRAGRPGQGDRRHRRGPPGPGLDARRPARPTPVARLPLWSSPPAPPAASKLSSAASSPARCRPRPLVPPASTSVPRGEACPLCAGHPGAVAPLEERPPGARHRRPSGMARRGPPAARGRAGAACWTRRPAAS